MAEQDPLLEKVGKGLRLKLLAVEDTTNVLFHSHRFLTIRHRHLYIFWKAFFRSMHAEKCPAYLYCSIHPCHQ